MRFGVISRGLALGAILTLLAVLLPSTQATSSQQVTTCTNIENRHERISRTSDCRTGREFTSRWHLAASDSKIDLSSNRTMVLCSNKSTSPVEYKVIRAKCAKHQISTEYFRSKVKPPQLVIETVTATGHDSAQIILKKPLRTDLDNPIAFYTVTPSTGLAQRVFSWKELSVTINTLSALTSYTFTITATSVDGTSVASAASQKITTSAYTPPPSSGNSTPTLAAPAFTLSAIAETKTVNTSISGYTITSTGGTIASYAISPAAPSGTTFNTATGLLTGTPTATQSATAYTITATNASGSATRTFTLTVSAVVYTVGQTGPGGGKVFYASNTPFACGPTLNLSCTYLEYSPKLWRGIGSYETDTAGVRWSGNINTTVPGGTGTAIGSGYKNTLAIVQQDSTTVRAATLTRAYAGNGLTDWYLPSLDELTAIRAYAVSTGAMDWVIDFPAQYYWSSSEISATNAWAIDFNDNSNDNESKNRDAAYFARPIRAF